VDYKKKVSKLNLKIATGKYEEKMKYLFLILTVCLFSCANIQKVTYHEFTAVIDLGEMPILSGPVFVPFIPLNESIFITSGNSIDPGNQQLKINLLNNSEICCYTNEIKNGFHCSKEPIMMYYDTRCIINTTTGKFTTNWFVIESNLRSYVLLAFNPIIINNF
jgi:hypothetical protein